MLSWRFFLLMVQSDQRTHHAVIIGAHANAWGAFALARISGAGRCIQQVSDAGKLSQLAGRIRHIQYAISPFRTNLIGLNRHTAQPCVYAQLAMT